KAEEAEPLTETQLITKLKKSLGQRVHILAFKEVSELVFGKSVYASAMVLGAAYQSGRLPFSLDNLTHAFNNSMKSSELHNNLEAFRLGRLCYEHGSESVLASGKRDSLSAS